MLHGILSHVHSCCSAEMFPLWNLGKHFFIWGSGIGWVSHKVWVLSVLQFVIWGVYLLSLSAVRRPVLVPAGGNHLPRSWGKQERGRGRLFRMKAFFLLSILLLWRTAFLDRLFKFWGMWSPFQCCLSSSFLSGQYQGRCQAGDGFTSFQFLHFLGFIALWLLFPLSGWNSKPK